MMHLILVAVSLWTRPPGPAPVCRALKNLPLIPAVKTDSWNLSLRHHSDVHIAQELHLRHLQDLSCATTGMSTTRQELQLWGITVFCTPGHHLEAARPAQQGHRRSDAYCNCEVSMVRRAVWTWEKTSTHDGEVNLHEKHNRASTIGNQTATGESQWSAEKPGPWGSASAGTKEMSTTMTLQFSAVEHGHHVATVLRGT